MPQNRSAPTRLAVVAAALAAAGAATLLPGGSPVATAAGLTPYASCDALLGHYRRELAEPPQAITTPAGATLEAAAPVAAAPVAAAPEAAAAGTVDAVGSGPTGTNLQEQGVDEPDVAKLAGGRLYAVAQGRLQITTTGPSPALLGSHPLGGRGDGAELLVVGDRVLVLVPSSPVVGADVASPVPDATLPAGGQGLTRLLLLDVREPSAPRLLEELELDGRYLSARLVGGTVRLVTASTPVLPATSYPGPPYGPAEQQAAREANRQSAERLGLAALLPRAVRRGPGGEVREDGPAVSCEAVRHPAEPRGATTLLVTTLRPADGLDAVDSTGVTTDGELVYAAPDRLYVATSRYSLGPEPAASSAAPAQTEVTTQVHAFDTTDDQTAYVGSGSVPGHVLGRWALSSWDGHLRVATTLQAPWEPSATTSSSSVVVLAERDGALVQTGRVDGLGPGERIYAVRYFGPLATVVTFRQTDPLYVLDLADPQAPRLLGELKVPGFSTYLHPVGEDLLLGVGHDADAQGRVTGMQVSVFDLRDRARPRQVDRLSLGQGWSAALDDSRAFGYDPQRRLAVLPFSSSAGTNAALGIRVGADGRLVEAGRLAVSDDAQPLRVLQDGGAVYAVSRLGVVAAAPEDLRRTGAADFRG